VAPRFEHLPKSGLMFTVAYKEMAPATVKEKSK
jgi:hypothetical protein